MFISCVLENNNYSKYTVTKGSGLAVTTKEKLTGNKSTHTHGNNRSDQATKHVIGNLRSKQPLSTTDHHQTLMNLTIQGA